MARMHLQTRMRRDSAVAAVLTSMALAVCFVVAAIAYVPTRRDLFGSALCGDALSYAAMIDGSRIVKEPFRFRPLVPLLASTLPLVPEWALAAVSWLSLLGSYVLLLETARVLRISRAAATVGLAVCMCAAPHLYNYYNPYLTDATGLLALATALYALVTRRYLLFTVACALGASAREPVAAVAPSWVATGQWRKAALSLFLSLSVVVAIRVIVGPSGLPPDEPFVFPARAPHRIIADALGAWHLHWIVVPIGLWRLPTHRRELGLFACSLLGAAMLTGLFASDTARMFQPLFVVSVLGFASAVEVLWQRSRATAIAVCSSCVLSSLVWQPVRFFALPVHSPAERAAHAAAYVLLTIIAGVAVVVLKRRRGARTEAFSMVPAA